MGKWPTDGRDRLTTRTGPAGDSQRGTGGADGPRGSRRGRIKRPTRLDFQPHRRRPEGERVAEAVEPRKRAPRSRPAKWLRRLAAAAAAYLLAWAATWAFAPAAVDRWWAAHHNPTGSDLGGGNPQPVEFRTGVHFRGERFEYGPDF